MIELAHLRSFLHTHVVKKRIILFLRGFSVYSSLFFIASASILLLSPVLSSASSTNSDPPFQLNLGEISKQTIHVGNGQEFRIIAQTSYTLRITIIQKNNYSEYLQNSSSEYTLFDQEVKRINFHVTFKKYSVLYIFWNNSVITEDSINSNYIISKQSITGLDFDTLLLSIILLFCGFFIEIVHLSMKKLSQNVKFFQSQNQKAPQMYSKFRNLFLLYNQESFKSSYIFSFIVIMLLWFLIIPSEQFLLTSPSKYDLAVRLIYLWKNNMDKIGFLWITIIGLIGFQLWKSKIETSELKNDFSLPIRRSYLAMIQLLNVLPSCCFALILPFLTSMALNKLRFGFFPDLSLVFFVLLWFIFYSIVLVLLGSIIGLLRPYSALYQGILVYFISIGILLLVNILFFPNIITPLPNGLDTISSVFISQSLIQSRWIDLFITTIIMISGLLIVYIYAVESLEVN